MRKVMLVISFYDPQLKKKKSVNIIHMFINRLTRSEKTRFYSNGTNEIRYVVEDIFLSNNPLKKNLLFRLFHG